MKVLFVDHSGLPGGGQLGLRRYMEMASALDRHVIVLGGHAAFEGLPVDTVTTLGTETSHARALLRAGALYAEIRKRRPDVVVANSTVAAAAICLTPRVNGVKYVFYLRDGLDKARMSPLQWQFRTNVILRRFDAFLANSAWTMSTLPTRQLRRPHRVAYPVSGARTTRRVGNLQRSSLRVLSLSRIAQWKGIDVLIDAIAEMNARGHSADVEVIVAGSAIHEARDYERQVRLRAQEVAPNVSFLGHVENVRGLLAESDVLVSCSIVPEPFGQVIVQGMSAGLVVIATDQGGPREIISAGESGILVPPNDPHALVNALLQLLEDRQQVDHIGTEAVRASKAFSDESTSQALSAALTALLAECNGSPVRPALVARKTEMDS